MYKICDIQNKNYKAAVAPLKETSRSESATSTVSSEPSVVSRQSYAFDRSCHTARKKIRMMTKKRRRIMMTTPPESPDNNVTNASIPSPQPSPELLVIPSAYIMRRAEAILKVLSDNTAASETEIRQVLGDNPTTSKALRMLLKGKAVKRSGAGGSTDPYVYMARY
ncbi:hypothetical protein MKW98_009530 [Papaver atlanticum]|uniref:HTH three-helical bundle domain-containing protein n=1 Tax=Papaver atlanticum TaxID=357466 RepID=A0AAD4SGI1_9MAGN|nr:hypothetical protein MKW98_009530 [Papaver atlanticum]